jgi:protein-S-isoprenylcysteine O-methyltransferase Ste14
MTLKRLMIPIGDFLFKWRNQLFPVITLLAFIAVKPSNTFLGREDFEPVRDLIAILIMVAGLAMRSSVIGFAYIQRGGLKKKVYAAALVTSGMFGVCRNPLYVGNMLICLAVFVMHGAPVIMIGGPLLFAFIYQSIIYAEERFLTEKFGDDYLAYCADVPRWGLRLSRFREATEGMRFDLKKALRADYGTILTGVFMLSSVELYERLAWPDEEQGTVVAILVGLMVFAVIGSIAFHYYKKLTYKPVV